MTARGQGQVNAYENTIHIMSQEIESLKSKNDDLLRVIFWLANRHDIIHDKDTLYVIFGNKRDKVDDPDGTKGPYETKLIIEHPDQELIKKLDAGSIKDQLPKWVKGIEYYGRVV